MRISFSSWATRESVRLRGLRRWGATKMQAFLPFAHRWHWFGVVGLGRQRTFRLLHDSQERFSCCCCWLGGCWDCPELDSPWGVPVVEDSDMFTRTRGRNQQGKNKDKKKKTPKVQGSSSEPQVSVSDWMPAA